MRKQPHLVCQHLERISRTAVEKYQAILKKFVRGRHGIYALYRKGKLCYVGLATNLRGRITHHLRDRHAHSWDSFSVYLTIESDHLRELEALAIRIAAPRENRQKGRLRKSEDLKRRFQKDLKVQLQNELCEMFGTEAKSKHSKGVISFDGRRPRLAGYFPKGKKIRWDYKNKRYRALIKKNGTIRFSGKIYTSPSLAAEAITKRAMNGWFCWKYERAPGDWVILNELRK